MNAKIGSNNTGLEDTMGKQGVGEMNNNGERLAIFCKENDFVIGGTKTIQKTTWNSPDGKNQINHIIINSKWRGSLQDISVRRGADIGSDPSLVMAKLRLKLRKARKKDQRPPHVDVQKLKKSRYKETLSIRH